MPEITPDVLIFQVDFNNVDADGAVKGTFAHARSDRVPSIDERVLLMDAEGNACAATVTQVSRLTLRFAADLATWRTADELHASGIPAFDEPVLRWTSSSEMVPA